VQQSMDKVIAELNTIVATLTPAKAEEVTVGQRLARRAGPGFPRTAITAGPLDEQPMN